MTRAADLRGTSEAAEIAAALGGARPAYEAATRAAIGSDDYGEAQIRIRHELRRLAGVGPRRDLQLGRSLAERNN